MAGSTFGTIFRIMTWGESHGKAVGVTIDGCPAGILLNEEDIQLFLDRRKPGQSKFTTMRNEADQVEILSGVFEGKTTGTPIALIVRNQDQKSRDYTNIKGVYRPSHADFCFDQKYGFRDYRGGGRSSGRETIGRVAAGAIASKFLESNGIKVRAFTKSIGEFQVDPLNFQWDARNENALYMPDEKTAVKAQAWLETLIEECDSAGGVVECIIDGVPSGLGEPVFDKMDACLAQAIFSIGAVKGFEVGNGFEAARMRGSENNDSFIIGADGKVGKKTNYAGGILGGITDGTTITLRAAFKPTPSIAREQQTINNKGEEVSIQIKGRHDPIIVPRAVVVVEAMTAITIADLLLRNKTAKFAVEE